MKMVLTTCLLIVVWLTTIWGGDSETKSDIFNRKEVARMKITSSAFKEGDTIPVKYTCDGADLSPQLEISGVPEGAKSLALICDDPDAPVGDWVHWVIYGIPSDMSGLPENVNKSLDPKIKVGNTDITFSQGKNDFGKFGYNGPCPPRGPAHRYYFKLFALDDNLKFEESQVRNGITKSLLLERIKGHILAEGSLMGRYKRQ